jgi:hypothetical protein
MLAPVSMTSGQHLIGRDDELRSLLGRLDGVSSDGRAIWLVGEPGIGKSALLAGVAEQARSLGLTVLTARGSQSERHLPFAGLHQVLRPLLPRVDRLPAIQRDALLACFGMHDSAEVNPFFTFLAVLELLVDSAAQQPVLVCIDDVLWIDQPSIDALAFVSRRIAGERVIVVCTSRPGSPPFADAQTIEWMEGDEDLPMATRLEQAFAARAEHLDPATRTVLTIAAVDDGDDLDDVLAAAEILHGSPLDRVTAQPAFEHGLLTAVGERYRIAHPLVGSALRQAMPAATRQRAHAALARVLADQPDRAVWHRASSVSGRDEQIAAELEHAAANAQRRGAVAAAAACLERAAALSPDPQAQAARLLSAANSATSWAGSARSSRSRRRSPECPSGTGTGRG